VTPATVPAPAPAPPVASFRWVPSTPHPSEPVTLISTSTDANSALTGFAWASAGNGAFIAGESALTTSFSTAGAHVVQLQVADANGLSSVVAETITVTAPAPTLIQPFPIVRMAGSFDAAGAKISLLTVQAPLGSTIKVICRGTGCPTKSETVVVASGAKSKPGTVLVTLRRFERPLRAGTVLEIEVSDHGAIGKFTRFTIHHGKLPSRQDQCLNPAGSTPILCPS
jgi:PKD repeat protein